MTTRNCFGCGGEIVGDASTRCPDCGEPTPGLDNVEFVKLARSVEVPPVGKETILEEAGRLTSGDRNRQYGHPLDDFSAQAEMFSAYLSKKHRIDIRLDYMDVAMLFVLTKVARQANAPKRDNLVDGAGYFRCAEMCEDEAKARYE